MSPESAHDSWQFQVLPHVSKDVLHTLTYPDQGNAEKRILLAVILRQLNQMQNSVTRSIVFIVISTESPA